MQSVQHTAVPLEHSLTSSSSSSGSRTPALRIAWITRPAGSGGTKDHRRAGNVSGCGREMAGA